MDSNVLRGCIHLVALHGLNVYSGDTLNDGVHNNQPRELHGLAGRARCELLDASDYVPARARPA